MLKLVNMSNNVADLKTLGNVS